MAGSDSRVVQLNGSDSFSLREPTAQEADSDPSRTNSLSEALLLSIPEFHSIANAMEIRFLFEPS
jgi:hypothetical protein